MRLEDRCDLLADVRITPHDTAAFLALVEAIAAKHENRRRMERMPEPEPEVINEDALYVG